MAANPAPDCTVPSMTEILPTELRTASRTVESGYQTTNTSSLSS
jgi:hypothetical protein